MLFRSFTAITPTSPARPGETIQVFLTGLGATTPAGVDGAPGPSNPLAFTANSITSYVNNTLAKVGFAGLAPGFIGLYQMNLTLPSALTTGDVYLDISGPDSYTSQAKLPIGTGSTASPEFRSVQEENPARRGRPVRTRLDTARGADFKSAWD